MMWCSLVVVLLVELASSVLGHGVKQSNSTSSSIPTSPLANSTRSPADSQPSQDITAILPRLVHQDTLCIPLSFLLEVTNEVSTSPRVAQGNYNLDDRSLLKILCRRSLWANSQKLFLYQKVMHSAFTVEWQIWHTFELIINIKEVVHWAARPSKYFKANRFIGN